MSFKVHQQFDDEPKQDEVVPFLDSVETLVSGGIAFATPPDAGGPAVTGSRFELASRAEDAWLEWRPRIAVGVPALEGPTAERASLRWKSGVFSRSRSRRGWITRIDDEFVAVPTILLRPPRDAKDAALEFAGTSIPVDGLAGEPADVSDEVRILRVESLPGLPPASSGPKADLDVVGLPESATLLVHLGGDLGPTPVSAGRWRSRNGMILIDEAMGFADEGVGAPITDARTGALLGVLIPDPDGTRLGRLRPGPSN